MNEHGKEKSKEMANGKQPNGVNGVHPKANEIPKLNVGKSSAVPMNGHLEAKVTSPTLAPLAMEEEDNGWKVSEAQTLPTINGLASKKWKVKDLATPSTTSSITSSTTTNGNAAQNGKRPREQPASQEKMVNGHKVVSMAREEDEDMDSYEDSDAEESAESTEEEYEDHFSEEEEEEDERPAPKKQKLETKATNAPVVLKWDEKKQPMLAGVPNPAKAGKKVDWDKAMRHEQYDKQSKPILLLLTLFFFFSLFFTD